jgi:hypothetical protein
MNTAREGCLAVSYVRYLIYKEARDAPKAKENKMSAFTPTLRLLLGPAEMEELLVKRQTLEVLTQSVKDFFLAQDFSIPVTFSAERILVLEDKSCLLNFKGLVVATFEVNGSSYMKLSTGDVVEIKFYEVK